MRFFVPAVSGLILSIGLSASPASAQAFASLTTGSISGERDCVSPNEQQCKKAARKEYHDDLRKAQDEFTRASKKARATYKKELKQAETQQQRKAAQRHFKQARKAALDEYKDDKRDARQEYKQALK